MKNICFFLYDITQCGGCERVTSTIANGLCRMGKYNIFLLSLVGGKEEPFFPLSSGIRKSALKNDGKRVLPGPGYLRMIPLLRKYLRKQNIDIIVDVDIVLDILTIPARTGMKVKMISWEHFHYYYEQSVLYRRIISRLSVHFSDYMVTLTERDRQNYRKMVHHKERIMAIGNPVNIPCDDMMIPKRKILVTVGRLEYAKGIDMLAKIVPHILGRYKDWKWYFLGDGEDRELLERVCRDYELDGRLILTGTVDDIESYLKNSSIMVMTSRSEGLPMSLLEARTWGIPCVAFNVPVGPAELIDDGVNGFLISPFELDEMVEKIAQLIEEEELWEKFACAARKGLEKYQLNVILDKWVGLLDSI